MADPIVDAANMIKAQTVVDPATGQTDLDVEIEKIGKTIAKIAAGIHAVLDTLGSLVPQALRDLLAGAVVAIGTNLINKTLAKYGIK